MVAGCGIMRRSRQELSGHTRCHESWEQEMASASVERNTVWHGLLCLAVGLIGIVGVIFALPTLAASKEPRTVHFLSDDGTTTLVAYLYRPDGVTGPAPAVVTMHGRAGPYSSVAKGVYDAKTLSKRNKDWAALWTGQGYWALVVDGFGPRGYPTGFPAGTDGDRPAAVNEVTVRPLDAYAALKYLRSLPDVKLDRIGIQGWSNGGSATLATVSEAGLANSKLGDGKGFAAALAFYPGCGLQGAFKDGYKAYLPLKLFIGTADEEVSPAACAKLTKNAKAGGSDIELTTYDGATHDATHSAFFAVPSFNCHKRVLERAEQADQQET
jgi:dienelactone hydrolase